MELTKEEISAIANRLDEVIGNHFYDAICSIIDEREFSDSKYMEISDEDVAKIKTELKRTLYDSEPLHTEVFNLANKLAINGYGNEAVKMHVICNGM